MTEYEYKEIKERILKHRIDLPTNKEDEYNKGLLSALSIVRSVYKKSQKNLA